MSENAVPSQIKLISSEGEEFLVDVTIDEGDIPDVPLPSVRSDVLKKVIEYCERHRDSPVIVYDDRTRKLTDISEWDKRYLNVDQEMLFGIIKAANYLDISPLLDVACKTVANMIRGKSADEIRETFHIVNDFTEDEIAEIKRDNGWVEEI